MYHATGEFLAAPARHALGHFFVKFESESIPLHQDFPCAIHEGSALDFFEGVQTDLIEFGLNATDGVGN
jgi:hypothetical protein